MLTSAAKQSIWSMREHRLGSVCRSGRGQSCPGSATPNSSPHWREQVIAAGEVSGLRMKVVGPHWRRCSQRLSDQPEEVLTRSRARHRRESLPQIAKSSTRPSSSHLRRVFLSVNSTEPWGTPPRVLFELNRRIFHAASRFVSKDDHVGIVFVDGEVIPLPVAV